MKDRRYLLAGIAAIFLFVGVGCWWLLQPRYVAILPGQIASPDSPVVSSLLESNVDYRIDEATGEILVPASKLHELRAKLASLGLPAAGEAGFEAFAGDEYGMSDFVQSVNYQRALEVELARSIRKLDGIKSARVHLTLAKESLFKDRERMAKASVIIEPADQDAIYAAKVAGIKEIVATAVHNLDRENISVLHINGSPLGGEFSGTNHSIANQGVEQHYRALIEDLLQDLESAVSVRVAVKVEIDPTKSTTFEETVIPKNEQGEGYIKQRRLVSGPTASDSSTQGGQRTTEEVDYLYSLKRSERVTLAGGIKRINVGIVLIGDNLDQEYIEQLRGVISSSLGLDAGRGDSLDIASLPKAPASTLRPVPATGESSKLDGPAENIPVTPESMSDRYKVPIVLTVSMMLVLILVLYLRERRLRKRVPRGFRSDHERQLFVKELKEWLEV